jgi:NADPH:quinone reductase
VKAVVAEELSGPSGLAYRDVDDIPDRVDGAVVIDVRAAGVCYPDLLVIRGEYQMKAPPPFIPGSEVAGVVRSAPEDSDLEPGDRVAAATMHGGYAERIAVAVLGSAGGIGSAAVQIAKALGAKVIAAVHRPEGTDYVASLGADVVLPRAGCS